LPKLLCLKSAKAPEFALRTGTEGLLPGPCSTASLWPLSNLEPFFLVKLRLYLSILGAHGDHKLIDIVDFNCLLIYSAPAMKTFIFLLFSFVMTVPAFSDVGFNAENHTIAVTISSDSTGAGNLDRFEFQLKGPDDRRSIKLTRMSLTRELISKEVAVLKDGDLKREMTDMLVASFMSRFLLLEFTTELLDLIKRLDKYNTLTISQVCKKCQIKGPGTWIWKGIEVIGNSATKTEAIRAAIPLKLSTVFKHDRKQWDLWCSELKNKFRLYWARCSAVRYSSYDAYFTVNIVENKDKDRIEFRDKPTEAVSFDAPLLPELYAKIQARTMKLFNEGKPPNEFVKNGYLNYQDGVISKWVSELAKSTPGHVENLIDILKSDHNEGNRAMAANLLNWSQGKMEETIHRASELLNDPSALVRNNITRFMLHFVSTIRSNDVKSALVRVFLIQLERPFHGDRNKALYALLELARTSKKTAKEILSLGEKQIKYLRDQSILSNIKGPAAELLKM